MSSSAAEKVSQFSYKQEENVVLLHLFIRPRFALTNPIPQRSYRNRMLTSRNNRSILHLTQSNHSYTTALFSVLYQTKNNLYSIAYTIYIIYFFLSECKPNVPTLHSRWHDHLIDVQICWSTKYSPSSLVEILCHPSYPWKQKKLPDSWFLLVI